MSLRDRYGRALVRHRLLALAIILVLTALAGLGIAQRLNAGLPVDFTPQAIFIDAGPMVDRLDEIQESFGREDNDLLLVLDGPALASDAGEQALRDIEEKMLDAPEVDTVTSLLTVPAIQNEDGTLIIEPPLEGRSMADALTLAAADPYLQGLVVSADATTTVVRVRIDPALEAVGDLGPVIRRLEGQARTVTLPDGVDLLVTGVPFVRTEVVEMMLTDQTRFAPIVAVMFAVTICVLFRRVQLGLGPLFAVLGAVIWAMGVLFVGGATLNILSILVPVLVLVIGIADGIHLVSRYREELFIDQDPEAAMGRTLHHMMVACFLTTFTTAASFASLLVADTRVIRDFGLHSAIAVMVTFVAVILILPVWVAFVPKDRVGEPPTERPSAEKRIFAGLDALVWKRPGTVLTVTLLMTVIAGAAGSTVRPNSRLLEMYHDAHPTWSAIKRTEQQLSGVVPIFIHLEAGAGDFLEPARLERMKQLQGELETWEMVRWTTSLSETVERIHETLTDQTGLPTDRETIAQELLVAEVSGDLPLETIATADYRQVRIMALCADIGGRKFVQMRDHMQARADALFADEGVRADVTGDGLIASVGVNGLIEDLMTSVGLIFVVILGAMWVTLRDFKLAVVTSLPNVLPLVFTLAMLWAISADLQTSNVVTFTVAVGLAVDDTIHFLVRYRQELDAGHDHKAAVRRTFLGAGHAIVLTSLLLVAGLGVLATSSLTTTRHFGLLSSVTMVAAVLADLFLLPALLHMVQARTAQRQA